MIAIYAKFIVKKINEEVKAYFEVRESNVAADKPYTLYRVIGNDCWSKGMFDTELEAVEFARASIENNDDYELIQFDAAED